MTEEERRKLLIKQREIEIRKEQSRGGPAAPTAKFWGIKKAWVGDKAVKQSQQTQAKVQKQNTMESSNMSRIDLQMQNFKTANAKLAKNKSQLPNLAVQAKIFEPVTPGRRKFFKDWHKIPVLGQKNDIIVEHKFHQLNQLDLTGWLMVIKFAGPDFVSTFTRYEFLKAMKKDDTGKDYKWLRAFLDRIGETRFAITVCSKEKKWIKYTGSLAPQDLERQDGKFAIQLSEPLAAMFGFDGWSFIDLNKRLALGQKQWAQAFHAWCSTNKCTAGGFWWKKEKLWQEWGPEYKSLGNFMKDFRRRVLKPLYNIDFIRKIEEKKNAVGLWW